MKLIFLLIIVLLPSFSYACKCVGKDEYYSVFIGTVKEIQLDSRSNQTVFFAKIKNIRSVWQESNAVFSPHVLACGINFEVGAVYKVFVSNSAAPPSNKKQLHTLYCYGTTKQKNL